MLQNITLIGGNTQLLGLDARLEDELGKLFPQVSRDKIKTKSIADSKNLAWQGALKHLKEQSAA